MNVQWSPQNLIMLGFLSTSRYLLTTLYSFNGLFQVEKHLHWIEQFKENRHFCYLDGFHTNWHTLLGCPLVFSNWTIVRRRKHWLVQKLSWASITDGVLSGFQSAQSFLCALFRCDDQFTQYWTIATSMKSAFGQREYPKRTPVFWRLQSRGAMKIKQKIFSI